MPSGKTHAKITKMVAGGVAAASVSALVLNPELSTHIAVPVEIASGVLITIWINPDGDLHNKLGLLGELLGFEQYKRIVPHRGGMRMSHWGNVKNLVFMSHIPWIGTFYRFVLLAMVPACIIALARWPFPFRFFFWTWFGMGLGDLFHFLADYITSGMTADRRIKLNKQKRRRNSRVTCRHFVED